MTQISYDHGVSTKKLIGETIGNFFDRTVETYRDREALVVRHQDVRWSWGRSCSSTTPSTSSSPRAPRGTRKAPRSAITTS